MKKLIGIAIIATLVAATSVTSTRLVSELTVSEQLNTASISDVVRHTTLNEVVNFRNDSASNTDVDNVYSKRLTSDGTIDLTSLTNSLGETMDLTGERVMAIKFKNAATTGTDAVNITQGATNPYPLFGASYSFDLNPRQSILYKCDSMLVDVDASNLGIDYTLNSDTLDVILISADLDN